MKYPEIVEKVKLLYTGGGTPLIKPGVFSDDFIDGQVCLVMDEKKLSTKEIDAIVRYCVNFNLSKEDSEKKLMEFLNWGSKPDEKFWRESGSIIIKKEYFKGCSGKIPSNALGWEDVFTWERHDTFSEQRILLYHFYESVETLRELNKQKMILKSQESYMFDDARKYINAINNAKQTIEEDAIKFYRDPKNNLEDRIKLFELLGGKKSFIFHPKNKELNQIFEMHQEQGYCDRHQTLSTWEIIEWWMEEIAENRLKVDYSANKYHPKLKQTERNYVPSSAALNQLRNRYFNMLVVEGISEFIFDW
jgi:hypothetical protein